MYIYLLSSIFLTLVAHNTLFPYKSGFRKAHVHTQMVTSTLGLQTSSHVGTILQAHQDMVHISNELA